MCAASCGDPIEPGDLVVMINDRLVHLECEDPETAIAEPLSFDVDDAIAALVRPVMEQAEKVIATFGNLAHVLGLDTNRGRRSWRKAIAIHEHQERKAARTPAWKRGHDA